MDIGERGRVGARAACENTSPMARDADLGEGPRNEIVCRAVLAGSAPCTAQTAGKVAGAGRPVKPAPAGHCTLARIFDNLDLNSGRVGASIIVAMGLPLQSAGGKVAGRLPGLVLPATSQADGFRFASNPLLRSGFIMRFEHSWGQRQERHAAGIQRVKHSSEGTETARLRARS